MDKFFDEAAESAKKLEENNSVVEKGLLSKSFVGDALNHKFEDSQLAKSMIGDVEEKRPYMVLYDPIAVKKPKLLIIGHGRHGKDTVAEYFRDNFGMTFKSSSQMALEVFMFDILQKRHGYKNMEEAIDHCHKNQHIRTEWSDLITEYNKDDRARLAKQITDNQDAYVGMRCGLEIDECVNIELFDFIIWVDASDRLPLEDKSSFSIDKSYAHVLVDNNGAKEQLIPKLKALGNIIFK